MLRRDTFIFQYFLLGVMQWDSICHKISVGEFILRSLELPVVCIDTSI